jgi:hypothetical protein
LLPYCAVALVLVLAPGLVLGWLIRLRGWTWLTVAPWLSIALIAVAAVLARWVGLQWGWLPLVILLALGLLFRWDYLFRHPGEARAPGLPQPDGLVAGGSSDQQPGNFLTEEAILGLPAAAGQPVAVAADAGLSGAPASRAACQPDPAAGASQLVTPGSSAEPASGQIPNGFLVDRALTPDSPGSGATASAARVGETDRISDNPQPEPPPQTADHWGAGDVDATPAAWVATGPLAGVAGVSRASEMIAAARAELMANRLRANDLAAKRPWGDVGGQSASRFWDGPDPAFVSPVTGQADPAAAQGAGGEAVNTAATGADGSVAGRWFNPGLEPWALEATASASQVSDLSRLEQLSTVSGDRLAASLGISDAWPEAGQIPDHRHSAAAGSLGADGLAAAVSHSSEEKTNPLTAVNPAGYGPITQSDDSGQAISSTSAAAPIAAAGLTRSLAQLAGLLLAMILASWQFARLLGAADAVSQTYDSIFHLSAIRWIIDTGNGSSLDFNTMAGTGPASFYPAAFHDLAALVAQLVGADSVVFAANAVAWVMMAIIWPLSLFALVNALAPRLGRVGLIGAGVLACSFAPLPIWMLSWGVLYPQCLSIVLMPAGLALLIRRLGLAGSAAIGASGALPAGRSMARGSQVGWRKAGAQAAQSAPERSVTAADRAVHQLSASPVAAGRPTAGPVAAEWIALGFGMIGLYLAHPNGFQALLACAAPLWLVWCWRRYRQGFERHPHRWPLFALLALVGLAGVAAYWWLMPKPESRAPITSLTTSFGDLLTGAMGGLWPSWLIAGLTVVGLYVACRQRRYRWWLLPALVAASLSMVASGGSDSWWRDLLVGGFAADAHRLAGLAVVVIAPLTIIAFNWLVVGLIERLRAWINRPAPGLSAVVVLLALLGLLLGSQAGAISQAISQGHWSYALLANSPLLTSDEQALIDQLPGLVEADAVIATDAWDGSSMVYPLTGLASSSHDVAWVYNQDQAASPDLGIIQFHLRDAASEPTVCSALADLGIGYALDFPSSSIDGGDHPAPGLDNLAQAPGFTELARVGAAALYRVDAC